MRIEAIVAVIVVFAALGSAAAHEHMNIGSTTPGGGTVILAYDFARRTVVEPPGFTSIDPSFAPQLTDDPNAPIYPLAAGTTVRIEIVALDPEASAVVAGTTLDRVGERKKIGEAPVLHSHVTWGLDVPPGVVGEYRLSFKLLATGGYLESPVYTITITNQAVTTTSTSTTTTSTSSSTSTTATTLQEVRDDAYLCHRGGPAKGEPRAAPVARELADRFRSIDADLGPVQALCNPAAVGTDPEPLHPAVGHEAVKASPARGTPAFARQTHVVSDRFGTRTVELVKPLRVLVPGGMSEGVGPATVPPDAISSAPGGVKHMLCYAVATPKGAPKPSPIPAISVADRFGGVVVAVGKMTAACAPVSVGGGDPGAPADDGWATCYAAKAAKGQPTPPKRTDARNSASLGAHVLEGRGVAGLCVPACVDAPDACAVASGG